MPTTAPAMARMSMAPIDFNQERENNIIKNIAKEIVYECTQNEVQVSQELAQYLVKLTLLNPKHGFTASEVMPRSLTQQLVDLVVEQLQQDTPEMNCIRMQVYWDIIRLNVAELKKEHQTNMAERAEPFSSEILTLDQEDMNKLPKLLASYVLVVQGLGNQTMATQLKETIAAINSIFKSRDGAILVSQTEEQKMETLKLLAKRVTGARLYLKYSNRAGEGIEDVNQLANIIQEKKEKLQETNRRITSRVDDIRETLSNVFSMDFFLLDPFQTTDIYLPPECDINDLDYTKKILYIMLQNGLYNNDLQSILEEIDGNARYYLNQEDEILRKLHATIKDRETVPTTEVFNYFDRLGEIWTELQSFYYCIEAVEDVLKDFELINKEEYFLPTPLERAVILPTKSSALAGKKRSVETDKSLVLSSVILLPGEEDYNVEFNGFCAWTLYFTKGLLVPSNPQVESAAHNGLYYVFSSKNGRELWIKEPEYYIYQIYEYIRNNPELVELLNVYDALYKVKNFQLIKTAERKVSTKADESQTELHPIEKYWDKDYTFSVWELKKRALTLSRLVKCVTKSVQTVSPHSHFRASIGVLAAPDKDKEVQTKKDGSCVHPTIATYLYGLRGHREDKFCVVDLTRPIDESFEREIQLREKPSCKERRRELMYRRFFMEPCLSTESSEDKCTHYYSYDSSESNENTESNEGNESSVSGSMEEKSREYYFEYNGEA